MIHPHRLPIDTPNPFVQAPDWFVECFYLAEPALSRSEINRVWTCYLLLNPDLPQNKQPDFEIGAV